MSTLLNQLLIASIHYYHNFFQHPCCHCTSQSILIVSQTLTHSRFMKFHYFSCTTANDAAILRNQTNQQARQSETRLH